MGVSGAERLVRSREFRYERVADFCGKQFRSVDCAGVAVDSRGYLYVLTRSASLGVIVVDPNGRVAGQWGGGRFRRGHAIVAGPDDSIFCVDDQGHAVRKFTRDGGLLLEINRADAPADTGYIPGDIDSVRRAGPPFNTPTAVAVDRNGDLLVSDGYGNARVHRFSATGEFLGSFGEPGTGPGQFRLPHGIAVDGEQRIYVADRENSRVQVFTADGEFLSSWNSPRASSFAMDREGTVFVTEMGEVMQGEGDKKRLIRENARPGISIRNVRGEILAHLAPEDPEGDGLFFAPHSIALDRDGNFYVAEVSDSYSGGMAPADRPRLHKYVRR